jgi:predicted peroxiredoxin
MRTLVVKLTSGTEALERANQAFTVSSTAAASGVPTSLWLTGDAVWFAVPGHAEQVDLPLAAPMAELRDGVLALGTLTACTQCVGRRELTQGDLLPGVRIAGAATFVEESLADGAQALVY